ncbi:MULTISPECIES: YlzJ-like family protein [Gracilibacillus]|uniref:YlzJ-like family protein n=1 Tax=Gracilibacillus TaxID=74385 RepID=UPI000A7113D5|nr:MULTISPECIES: YlzJ-like family protein [Gracilibacillus]
MLYTPLSYEEIDDTKHAYEDFQLMRFQGRDCCVQKLANGDIRIVQLLSTNPNDYLIESLTPGTIIK